MTRIAEPFMPSGGRFQKGGCSSSRLAPAMARRVEGGEVGRSNDRAGHLKVDIVGGSGTGSAEVGAMGSRSMRWWSCS